MGQYYKACLINDNGIKIIRPSGWKMMEHCWYGNRGMERVEKLLNEEHYRVIWLGDYSPCAAFAWDSPLEEEDLCYDDEHEEGYTLEHKADKIYYLINHTRKEYICMNKQEVNEELMDNYKNVVHPLGLLCRADTEEAGGDYHSEINQDLLGIWCGDEINVLEVDDYRDLSLQELGYEDKTDVYFFKE